MGGTMKLTAMTTMMLIGAMAEGTTGPTADRTVTVYVEGSAAPVVVKQAKVIAAKMFAEIGVTIEWRSFGRGVPAPEIQIRLSQQTPDTMRPGTLAYALPYEGTHVRVFYDRIAENAARDLVPILLAHVLVHEITHMLQRVGRHSDRGIMKANWDEQDYSHMRSSPLTFTDVDIDLIYTGLAARRAGSVAAIDTTAAVAAQ